MLGYTRQDHANMMRGIRDGMFYLPPSAEESHNKSRDFLEHYLNCLRAVKKRMRI